MMWKYNYILIIGFALIACKKSEDRACMKSTGDPATKTILLEHFDRMYLGPHIQFNFIQDSTEKIVLEGGENMLNLIDASIFDNKLTITNSNKCNFLRTYKKHVKATIHFKELVNIEYDGTREAFCLDTIHAEYLSVTMNESAGKLNLLVNAKVLYAGVNKNWGNFDIKGEVDFLKISLQGNGFGSTYGLKVRDSIYVISNSGENVMINADNVMIKTQTMSSGDIWYKGTPTQINHQSLGSGQLLNKN